MRTRCCTTLALVLLLLTAACGGRGTDSANFAGPGETPADFTARTAMPPTWTPGSLNEAPRLQKPVSAEERLAEVPTA